MCQDRNQSIKKGKEESEWTNKINAGRGVWESFRGIRGGTKATSRRTRAVYLVTKKVGKGMKEKEKKKPRKVSLFQWPPSLNGREEKKGFGQGREKEVDVFRGRARKKKKVLWGGGVL